MVHIDKTYLRTILADAFKIPEDQVINPTLCIPIGKSIKMYSDAIERGASKGMHLLFCKNYEKVNNQWVYELENALAILIEPQFFRNIISEYTVTNQKLFVGMISIDLQSILELPNFIHIDTSIGIKSAETSVATPVPVIPEEIDFHIEYDPDMDRSADKFMRREYAAILLKVPSSGTKWLDEMINFSNKINNR